MKTVKQVSDLTGISIRMLHYYDEIGLLNPSSTTEAGYRLYDDEALENLQQILFFKELEIPLEEVKKLMTTPKFDKVKVLKNQKKLLVLKRNRLNDLIELIYKNLKGENTMSFKEFDMSEYFNFLEEFKKDCLEDRNPELKKLYENLVEDLSKEPSSKEIQEIAEDIYNTVRKDYEIFKAESGSDNWYYMLKSYLINPE